MLYASAWFERQTNYTSNRDVRAHAGFVHSHEAPSNTSSRPFSRNRIEEGSLIGLERGGGKPGMAMVITRLPD